MKWEEEEKGWKLSAQFLARDPPQPTNHPSQSHRHRQEEEEEEEALLLCLAGRGDVRHKFSPEEKGKMEEGGTADVLKGREEWGIITGRKEKREEERRLAEGVWLQLGRDAETPPVVPKLSLAQRDGRGGSDPVKLPSSSPFSSRVTHSLGQTDSHARLARAGFSWSTASDPNALHQSRVLWDSPDLYHILIH